MKNLWRVITAFVSLFIAMECAAQSYPRNLFAVNQIHFDAVQAQGWDYFLKSKTAGTVLSMIAAYMGIDSTYVLMAQSALPTTSKEGDQTTNYRIPVPPGYTYCASRIRFNSVIQGGSNPPYLNAAVNPREIQMTTVTPSQGLSGTFGGQTSIEGDVQVYGILPAYLDEFANKGICKKVTQHVFLFSCHGRSECEKGFAQGDPEQTGNAAPDLKKGFPGG
ncbi:hypothetical protein [Burkholderia ubonensis]|uniref:hypothetical protein n=1 Tax=Burkholderia ubonensis TaxID=101571 RepID=UPI0012F98110|nr:hypothetical protein [Burkholderia ubonensis]